MAELTCRLPTPWTRKHVLSARRRLSGASNVRKHSVQVQESSVPPPELRAEPKMQSQDAGEGNILPGWTHPELLDKPRPEDIQSFATGENGAVLKPQVRARQRVCL